MAIGELELNLHLTVASQKKKKGGIYPYLAAHLAGEKEDVLAHYFLAPRH